MGKIGADIQEIFPETPGEKGRLHPLKKGQTTRKECKNAARICSEKIRKAKTQLELT